MNRALIALKIALTILPIAMFMTVAVDAVAQEDRQGESPGERPFPLMVGDKAPGIVVEKWLQGDPIDRFEDGHVYIIDFWATWCRPCLQSIPHMVELQDKYRGKATVIGMNIWQPDPDSVGPFLDKMGDKMPYAIALDAVPSGEEANKGKMAQTWMDAAGQMGIPAAFVVDGDNRIAWIGHPSELDEPLAKIIEGRWDLERHAEVHRSRMEKVAKAAPVQERLYAAMEEENWDETVTACEELFAIDPDEFANAAVYKFQILLQKMGKAKEAYAYGYDIVEAGLKNKEWELNGIAWAIVDPEFQTDDRDLGLALKAAKRADELTGGEKPEIIDTLARVYFTKGEVGKAIELQRRALELAGDDDSETYQKTLDEYEAASSR